ncbi:exonuclease domain-containing protein [Vagococcus carniphilus]|uniref:DNA polymerase III polC-type n=1 Tax=Vagococcus carniphilus TaxID=218144 RepID=A0A430B8G2_9ENTE|nr:exonuclease domain-containing protein [Vagococcus carniphilus]QNN74120.1 ribonuclease H-like domain-containing protein [Vagococcus carniphilus]RSU16573.1 hypothetical protein CBF28_03330 [Vagococcus carniphilus]
MATYEETTNYILKDKYISDILNNSNLSEKHKYELIYRIVADYSHIKRVPTSLYTQDNLPTDYISFDIETTGLAYSDKMIQIAAVKYQNSKEVDYFSSFIDSDGKEISTPISYLTGITNDDLIGAPSLNIVMSQFIDFIDDLPLIGHNITSFELPRIKKWADIDLRSKVAVDTYDFSSTLPLEIDNYKLETLKNYYGIEAKSHNALDDSRTTAIIFENFRNKNFAKKIHSLSIKDTLNGYTFCYTGAIKMGRTTLESYITSRGGRVVKGMSKKVDYLICSPQIAKNLTDGKRSRKEIKFEELINDGFDIKKISEEDFLRMIGEN